MKVTIGFTWTDRANDYIPTMDGYRPGAEQEEVVIELPDAAVQGASARVIAEAVFVATNAPLEVVETHPLARVIWYLLPFGRWRALSIGDTVAIEGFSKLECARLGWKALLEV